MWQTALMGLRWANYAQNFINSFRGNANSAQTTYTAGNRIFR